jgi:hypothetical protein
MQTEWGANSSQCPAEPGAEAPNCPDVHLYPACARWDVILFLLVGIALAFVGFKIYRFAIACGGLVVSYFVFYPLLAAYTDLSQTVLYVLMIVIGLVLAVMFYFLADTLGIFVMGIFLGALIAGGTLLLLENIPDAKTWIQAQDWFPKIVLVVGALFYAVYALRHRNETVVSTTSLIGSFLIGDGISWLLGNSQPHFLLQNYVGAMGTDSDSPINSVCPLTTYVIVGVILIASLTGCVQGSIAAREARARERHRRDQDVAQGLLRNQSPFLTERDDHYVAV